MTTKWFWCWGIFSTRSNSTHYKRSLI